MISSGRIQPDSTSTPYHGSMLSFWIHSSWDLWSMKSLNPRFVLVLVGVLDWGPENRNWWEKNIKSNKNIGIFYLQDWVFFLMDFLIFFTILCSTKCNSGYSCGIEDISKQIVTPVMPLRKFRLTVMQPYILLLNGRLGIRISNKESTSHLYVHTSFRISQTTVEWRRSRKRYFRIGTSDCISLPHLTKFSS